MIDIPEAYAFDCETHKIQDGLPAPPLVCASLAGTDGTRRILNREQARAVIRRLLRDKKVIMGANIPFDFAVMAQDAIDLGEDLLPLIFEAYEEGNVFDVQTAMGLGAIADGLLFKDPRNGGPMLRLSGPKAGKQTYRYSLELVVLYVLGRMDAKSNDFWRLRYAILQDVPFEEWPEEARQYPIDDVGNTLESALGQLGFLPRVDWKQDASGGVRVIEPLENQEDMKLQAYAHWAMYLGAVWGMRTDRERVTKLRAEAEAEHKSYVEQFIKVGFIRGAEEGKNAHGTKCKNAACPGCKENEGAVKRAVLMAYQHDGRPCPTCGGTGKILNAKGKPVGCSARNEEHLAGRPHCDSTGLDLATHRVVDDRYEPLPGHLTPRTPTGISTARDTLMEAGDETLLAYAENENEKILSTYLEFLEKGVDRPINLSPNVLVATGRTSYDGVVQLIPRDGGVRECIRARDGYVLCSTDYAAGELCTLGQVCLWVCGYSRMAEIINDSKDPGALHSAFAARMVGVDPELFLAVLNDRPYERSQLPSWVWTGFTAHEAKKANVKGDPDKAFAKYVKALFKGLRQAAKAANFGFPGGMGAARMVLSKRKKSEGTTTAPDGTVYAGIRFCLLVPDEHGRTEERCGITKVTEWNGFETPPICKRCVEIAQYVLKPIYFKMYPEMNEYFRWVTSEVESSGQLRSFVSNRLRGGLDFKNGANNGFQALLADIGKWGLCMLSKECYTDRDSPLWGTRPIFFAHDDVISEMPIETAHLAGPRQAEIMIKASKVPPPWQDIPFCPDVFMTAAPALMTHWSKAAEPVYDANGNLTIWQP